MVIDEMQRTPELFSYLQIGDDENHWAEEPVLTGSRKFLLTERMSRTLAGRSAPSRLPALSMPEFENRPG